MGGGKTPTPVFRKPPVDETMAKAEAEAFGGGSKPKKQQSILSAFAMDTACFMDELLVKGMKSAKKARASAKATNAVASAVTTEGKK